MIVPMIGEIRPLPVKVGTANPSRSRIHSRTISLQSTVGMERASDSQNRSRNIAGS